MMTAVLQVRCKTETILDREDKLDRTAVDEMLLAPIEDSHVIDFGMDELKAREENVDQCCQPRMSQGIRDRLASATGMLHYVEVNFWHVLG